MSNINELVQELKENGEAALQPFEEHYQIYSTDCPDAVFIEAMSRKLRKRYGIKVSIDLDNESINLVSSK